MGYVSVTVCLTILLLTHKLAACDWTFSLRITSAQCCTSTTCDRVGTCDDLFFLLCLRPPATPRENRESCGILIAGNGSAITNRELTPASVVTPNLDPLGKTRISDTYPGGIQIYIAVLTMPDIAPLNDDDIIDEMFVEPEVSLVDGGETSAVAHGENGRANMTFSPISVQCSPGYSGDDCETLNTCSQGITCNMTLGYCNSGGECICNDEDIECFDIATEDPSSNAPSSKSEDVDIVPIIVGVVVGVLLVVIVLVIIVVVAIILYRKRREKKWIEMTILTGPLDTSSTASTTSNISPPIPLYSTVNKDKKRSAPPVPDPYQVDESSGEMDDVAYATTQHNRQNLESSDEVENEKPPFRNSQGLVYADLDIHSLAKKTGPPKPPREEVPSSSQPLSTDPPPDTEAVSYTTVNPYATPRTPPQPAPRPGEAAYYSVVHS